MLDMLKGLNLDIDGFGLINEAHIEIGKITVVGGINSSGKSTASKILYCFLKVMSLNRKEYLLSLILPVVNNFLSIMLKPDPSGEADLDINFTLDDDFYEILREYKTAKTIFEALPKTFFDPPYEIFSEMATCIEKVFLILLDKGENDYSPVVKSLFSDELLLSFEVGNSSFYNDSFKSSVSYEYTPGYSFEDYLGENREFYLQLTNCFYDDFDSKFVYLTEGEFDFISDVCYIDSISIFDLDYAYSNNNYIFNNHIGYLLKQLKNDEGYITINVEEGILKKEKVDVKSKLSNDDISKMNHVNEQISNIIGGTISRRAEYYLGDKPFGKEYYYFQPLNSEDSFNFNISSGIQQIGIIQKLLSNYRLQPGAFLIIDEPEVNLHPEWQFKFAEILVLLAKELDITLYLNSHSPMFIESLNAFSQYYDMQDDVNYYLTEPSEVEGKYNFTKIPSNKLYKIYNNLGNVYDLIDKLRLEKQLGE